MTEKAKKTDVQKNKKRIKTVNLKRETIKELSGREQKNVKGGGGRISGIIMGYER